MIMKDCLEQFYKDYYALVFRIAFSQVKNHADAEDIAQEAFVRLLRSQPNFDCREHEKAWMIRVTLNLCKDLQKSKPYNVNVSMETVPEAEKAYFKMPCMEEDETLWAVLELPEKYRNCLYLFYYEEYSVRDIAKLFEMQENTVKTNLRRGREALKKILDLNRR